MSIHPSLKTSLKDRRLRSVLKKSERVQFLIDKGKWDKKSSIFGLPKVKTERIKIKKEKPAKKPKEEAPTEAQATPGEQIKQGG